MGHMLQGSRPFAGPSVVKGMVCALQKSPTDVPQGEEALQILHFIPSMHSFTLFPFIWSLPFHKISYLRSYKTGILHNNVREDNVNPFQRVCPEQGTSRQRWTGNPIVIWIIWSTYVAEQNHWNAYGLPDLGKNLGQAGTWEKQLPHFIFRLQNWREYSRNSMTLAVRGQHVLYLFEDREAVCIG